MKVLIIDDDEDLRNILAHHLKQEWPDLQVEQFDPLEREMPEASFPLGAYDVVILDPPSFTRNRASVPDALRGYKELHLRALKLLKQGGVMATFCCSHHVDAGLFLDTVLSAAYDQRRVLRRVAIYGQTLDHPVIPSIPETEYLKGFAFELVR